MSSSSLYDLVHSKVSKSLNKSEEWYLKKNNNNNYDFYMDLTCSVALLDKHDCIYAKNTRKLLYHSSLRTTHRVWDIEDMISLGKKVKGFKNKREKGYTKFYINRKLNLLIY